MKGQFRANNLSNAARRAIWAQGMKSVYSYDIVSDCVIRSEEKFYESPHTDRTVIVAYTRKGKKTATVSAGDLWWYDSCNSHQTMPMARIR